MSIGMDRIFRNEGERTLLGSTLNAFVRNGNTYFLARVNVYVDGLIDCWEMMDFDSFKQKVNAGKIVTQPPVGSWAEIPDLASFRISEISAIGALDLVGTVADVIDELNSRPTSLDRCQAAFDLFTREPTPEHTVALRAAYEAVPQHLRPFLGDQDVQDLSIRIALYGEQEVESWSHRKAMHMAGLSVEDDEDARQSGPETRGP